MNLTVRQRKFVDEYLLDFSAQKAAERAGYSPRTAQEQGSRLLSYVHVQKAISEALDGRREAINVEVDEIVEGLHDIANDFSNSAKDRLKALELLGKHLGMFTDKIDMRVTSVEQLLAEMEEDE